MFKAKAVIMKAAIFSSNHDSGSFLKITDVPRPTLRPGHLVLKVLACGVCRTDLHIVEGDLPMVGVTGFEPTTSCSRTKCIAAIKSNDFKKNT